MYPASNSKWPVSVLFPWSTCPMTIRFRWGLFDDDIYLLHSSDLEKNLCTAYKKPCPVPRPPEKKDLYLSGKGLNGNMVGSLAISQTANELVLETTSKHEAAPGGMGMQKTQYDMAVEQFQRAADIMRLDANTQEILRKPRRILSVNFPVKMDDGRIQPIRKEQQHSCCHRQTNHNRRITRKRCRNR